MTDINDSVVMKFPSGVTAAFSLSWEYNGTCEMIAYGSKGEVRLGHRFHNCHEVYLTVNDNNFSEKFEFDFKNGFVYQVKEAVDCIRSGKHESIIMPWSDTLSCAETMENLLDSWGIA